MFEVKSKLNVLLILLPVLVILVAGCIGPAPGVTTGNGVVIESLDLESPQVYSTETTKLRINIRNTGSVKAEDVCAKILGMDDWDYCVNPTETGCRCPTGSSLLPPSPEVGTEGESRVCTWNCEAPTLPATLSLHYSPTIRVFYDYTSDVVKSITIASREELKRLQDEGKALPAETTSSSRSPISLTIETKSPIAVWDTSVTFPLSIKIENVGGGIVCKSSCENTDHWNKLYLKIPTPTGATLTECTDYKDRWGEVYLWKGKDNTITCKVTVSTSAITTTKLIKAEAKYQYAIDKAESITVLARPV